MLINMREEDEKLKDLCTKLSALRSEKLSSFIKRVFVCGEKDLNRQYEETTSHEIVSDEIESLEMKVSDITSPMMEEAGFPRQKKPKKPDADTIMDPYNGGPPGIWG